MSQVKWEAWEESDISRYNDALATWMSDAWLAEEKGEDVDARERKIATAGHRSECNVDRSIETGEGCTWAWR